MVPFLNKCFLRGAEDNMNEGVEKRASIAMVITSCLYVKLLSRFEPTSDKSSVIYFFCCSLTFSLETLLLWSFSVSFLEKLKLLQVGVEKLLLCGCDV
uniref:MARVEL domain-containing protein n=1 Tax=Parascaris univalens TaxID=6257 RepID=A0A914ZR16_PARUN